MIRLYGDKLYGREELLLALYSCAQLAHVQTHQIEHVFDEIDDLESRLLFKKSDEKHDLLCELALPFANINDGINQQFRGHAIRAVIHRLGCLCALCFDTSGDGMIGDDVYLTSSFCEWLAPKTLICETSDVTGLAYDGQFGNAPVCHKCWYQICSVAKVLKLDDGAGEFSFGDQDDKGEWGSVLSQLLKRPSFQARVIENASVSQKLRFDPRARDGQPSKQRRLPKTQIPRSGKITYSVRETAAVVGVSTRTINEWLSSKKLLSFKLGGRRLIRRDDLEAFINGAANSQIDTRDPVTGIKGFRKTWPGPLTHEVVDSITGISDDIRGQLHAYVENMEGDNHAQH